MSAVAANDGLKKVTSLLGKRLASLLGLVVLAACAGSGPPVSVDRTVIGEDESPLVFADIQTPPLNGTFYELKTSDYKAGGVVGVWAGRTKYPHARIVYTYLSPGYYYALEWDSDDYLDDLNLGQATKLVRGEDGHKVNVLGRASYRRFQAESSECVAFSQQFGPTRRNTGNKKVAGHYCQAPHKRLDDHAITQILDGIGIRGVAVPERVARNQNPAKSPTEAIPFTGVWTNRYDSFKGRFLAMAINKNVGKILLTLPGNHGECVGKWYFGLSASSDEGQTSGNWSVVCTNGLTVEGKYWLKGRNGGADGKDQDGNAVHITFTR
jgi:hypothetical protein